jgi:hypothetical protein
MSTENRDQATPDAGPQTPVEQPTCCCCMSRKPVLIVLLILVLAAGAARLVIQQIGGNLRSTEPYQMAMQRILHDPQVAEALGSPIADSWRTAGRSEENEVDLRFEIRGPKGQAKVHAQGKRLQGAWELIILDVTVGESGKTLKPMQAEEGGAPLFESPKANEPAKPKEEEPAPQINLPVPPG